MNDDKLTSAIEKLTTEREKRLVKLANLRRELMSHIDPDDLEDTVPDVLEHEMTLGRIRELERSLHSMEHALQRVWQESYGICEQCGAQIDPDRLEVVPETTLCVQCKTVGERSGQVKMHMTEPLWSQEWRTHKLSMG